MKKRILSICVVCCILLAFLPVSVFADVSWQGNEWNTNAVWVIGREDPHANFFPYASEADAKEYHNYYPDKSPYYETLSGTWKFNHVMKPADRPLANGADSFETKGFDASAWDDIKVPSNWQVNWNEDGTFKYDHVIYKNSGYPWKGYGNDITDFVDGTAPQVFNPVGTYRRTFTIKPEWKDRSIFLALAGVESNCYIWINGRQVGYAEDSYTTKNFDITPYIDYDGINVIAIQVFRWSSGSWFEDQDFLRLSGIFRDVYMIAYPKVALYDFEVKTTPVEEDTYDGDWNLDIKALLRDLGATEAMKSGARLSATLYDADDKVVGSGAFSVPEYTTRANFIGNDYVGANIDFNLKVETPELWSAEHPNLYKLVLSLKNGDNLLETTCIRVGFREVKVVNPGTHDVRWLVNGSRILFYGTNAHENNPDTGHVADLEFIRRDIELMKANNVNAIRMSHYPHSTVYYDLADEYGLYVMDEANMECHGNRALVSIQENCKAWGPSLRDRLNNMMERDKNYPSIISWSMGNECWDAHDEYAFWVSGWAKVKDPTRPIHAEYRSNYADTDMLSGMYFGASSWRTNTNNSLKPTILCEYVHSQGNSNGNWDAYISMFDDLPKCNGGFIWEWADHCVWTPLPGNPNEKYFAFGGDWGDDPNAANMCADAMLLADRTPYPQFTEMKYSYRMLTATLKDNNTYTVNNKFLFTNANQYDMYWELKENDKVIQSGTGVLDVGPAPSGVVSTTITSKDFEVPFTVPETVTPGAEYFFNVTFTERNDTLWAEAGHVISESHMPVNFGQVASVQVPLPSGTIDVSDEEASVDISGKDFSLSINKADGTISSYVFKDRDLLVSGPAPNFWRAPNDNEYGASSTLNSLNSWKTVGSGRTTTSVTVEDFVSFVKVIVDGAFPAKDGTYTTTYTVYPNGEVEVNYNYAFPTLSSNAFVHEIGSMMTVKSDFENLAWFGRGPGESYVDRKWSKYVDLWESTVTDQFFPYAIGQEMGNKVETRWFALTDDDGFGMVVKGDLIEFNALHYSPFEMGERRYKHFFETEISDDIFLRVNLTSTGVGGDNSWGANPLTQYRVNASNQTYNYSYSILPVEKFDKDAAMVYAKTDYESVAFEVSATTPTLAEGYAANVLVKVTGPLAKSSDVTVSLFGKSMKAVNGEALFKLTKEEVPEAGDYEISAIVDGTSIKTVSTITVKSAANVWDVGINVAEGKTEFSFNAIIVPASKGFAVTVNKTNSFIPQKKDGENVLVIDYAVNSGDEIVISGVKYTELFPSYSFTFTLKAP